MSIICCRPHHRMLLLWQALEATPEPVVATSSLSTEERLKSSLNIVCPTCKEVIDPEPNGCIAINKGADKGGCPRGCDAFCWLCQEVCGDDAHPHCGRVHHEFFPPQRIIAQWERRYRWRRVQDVLVHAFPAGGATREDALREIRLNLQSHSLWPFPATEPAVSNPDEVEPAHSLDAAFAAARRGDAYVVRAALIYEPRFVNAVNERGMTMLMVAAHAGHDEVVDELLGSGARVEEQDERRMTALHMAVERGHANISRALLGAWPAGVTECNLRGIRLDEKSVQRLAKIGTEKRINLFGIKHGQTRADFSSQNLGSVDAILIANDLAVTASVTSVRAFRKIVEVVRVWGD
jgi:hypothetical protein